MLNWALVAVLVNVKRTPVTIAPLESFTVPDTVPTGDADRVVAAIAVTATKEYRFLEIEITLASQILMKRQLRGRPDYPLVLPLVYTKPEIELNRVNTR